MARLSMCLLIIFLAIVAEAAPHKPKKAKKCHDKKRYPECFKEKDRYCPAKCPRECHMDCATCTPVCSEPSTFPPFLSPPPPENENHPPPSLSPPPTTSTPPPTVSTPPSQNPPSPPDSSESAPKRVRCYNKNYATCYGQEYTCPSACPNQCEVDCTICKATVTGQVLCAKTRDSSVPMESPSTSMAKKTETFA
ncbi:unnamed protein product [Dovyalis caffra]|uniref:Uncharacterized protein n=1 Tax=Dovyalis caffra TaxID=77055 RepID=A0AAV1R935_9ROSI|nr:unnamed protein product [Dovyalis caffra]